MMKHPAAAAAFLSLIAAFPRLGCRAVEAAQIVRSVQLATPAPAAPPLSGLVSFPGPTTPGLSPAALPSMIPATPLASPIPSPTAPAAVAASPAVADVSVRDALRTLGAAVEDRDGQDAPSALNHRFDAAADGPAGDSVDGPQGAPDGAAEPAREPVRRNVDAEWQSFLQQRTLIDGKSKLTPEQIKKLAQFVRPVKAKADAAAPPIVGRAAEIKRVLPILTSPRGMRNSVVLVGEAGVGKTAVAEGLAQLIEESERGGADFIEMKSLKGRWLVELDLDALLTEKEPLNALNTVMRILPLLNDPEPRAGNKVILLMDEIQKFFLDQDGVKMANAMKGVLRDGRLSVLATTTEREFKKWIEPDDAFRRRLEPVRVAEPTVEQTVEMLRGAKSFLENLHGAAIPDESLVAAAKLHSQFDKENHNPDKSFKGVQDSAELSKPDNLRAAISLDIRETWRALHVALIEARRVLSGKGIATAAALPVELYNRIAGAAAQVAGFYEQLTAVKDGKGVVTPEVIKRSLTLKTGISSGQLTLGEEDAARYMRMEDELSERVVGQERAVKALAKALRRNKAGISDSNRPMAKFLMVGPTGTGKTYLTKELARFLFRDPEAVVRLDMSEYQQAHEVAKLIGSPPGYVGYGEGGQLTEKIRKKPYSVVLFDEIEKAHPKVYDMLLQILDEGRLTDGEGRTIDFKNTVIIMTSNVGMSEVDGTKYERLLKASKGPEEIAKIEAQWDAEISAAIKEGVRARFKPEFINRLDADPTTKDKWIRFERLRRRDVGVIARLRLGEFQKLLKERHDTDLVVTDEAVAFLAQEGYDPLYGARPMQDAVNNLIVDTLAAWILQEAEQGRRDVRGGLVKVAMKDGNIVFESLPRPAKAAEKTPVTGAAERLVKAALDAVEALVSGLRAEMPDAGEFEKVLKDPSTPGAAGAASAARPPVEGFAPGARLSLPETASFAAGADNGPNKKDAVLRDKTRDIVAAARQAGWGPDLTEALEIADGRTGAGFLKHFIRHAKETASKAALEVPVSVGAVVDAESVRIVIRGPHQIGAGEAAQLNAHFAGAPPRTYEEAQHRADALSRDGSMVWNPNLLDLYRRLSSLPGARWGYYSGPDGAEYWLEVRRAPPTPETSGSAMRGMGDAAKSRALMLRVAEQEGHALRIAAARGFAWLSGPEQAQEARNWIAERRLADPRHGNAALRQDWNIALTALLVLERFGSRDDIPAVEAVARNLSGATHHDLVPLHKAVVETLASLYRRSEATDARDALLRARSDGGDILAAAERAVESLTVGGAGPDVGDPGALATRHKQSPDAPRARELREALADLGDAWRGTKEGEKVAVLQVVGSDPRLGAEFLPSLKILLSDGLDDNRPVRYAAARAFAEIASRQGLFEDLPQLLARYLNEHSLESHDDKSWQSFLALANLAELAGGPDALAALEDAMKTPPDRVASVHEQAFFSLPLAWARIVARHGLFPQYARPDGDERGDKRPSKIEEMFASRDPMIVAAAIYAVALAQRAPGVEPADPIRPAAGKVPPLSWGPRSDY